MAHDVFFILGCVRSGTTLLRDILKSHPNLICPQETHIFRWAEPFATTDYTHVNLNAETLQLHRKMDNVNEADFQQIMHKSKDKGDFMLNYLQHFKKIHTQNDKRCFDKTPQNVYGLPLIMAFFPRAKIIHIHRNPLNVVASLKKGRGLLPQTLTGAINFWKESLLIINTLKPLLKDNLYEIKYEDLTQNPAFEIDQLLDFLAEEKADMSAIIKTIHPSNDNYLYELSSSEQQTVKHELADLMTQYQY